MNTSHHKVLRHFGASAIFSFSFVLLSPEVHAQLSEDTTRVQASVLTEDSKN